MSARTTVTGAPANRSRSAAARPGCSSIAITRAPASTSAAVSAPVPAPRSTTRSPSRIPARATTWRAARGSSRCQPQRAGADALRRGHGAPSPSSSCAASVAPHRPAVDRFLEPMMSESLGAGDTGRQGVPSTERSEVAGDVEVGVAGGVGGLDDLPGVVGAADLERGVDPGLADVEVDAFALVLHLDEVGAGGRRTRGAAGRGCRAGRRCGRRRRGAGRPRSRGGGSVRGPRRGRRCPRTARRRSCRSRRVPRARAEGGDADRAGAFDVELGPVHQHHHRVGDGVLVDGDDLVDPSVDRAVR